MLVNPQGIKDIIRKSFNGSIHELITELIQNAQRAKASHVDISLTPETLTIIDNGCGLTNPEAFVTLLTVGKSGFESEQSPFGVGFHAALAHEGVTRVIINSHGYQLEIDTHNYWITDYSKDTILSNLRLYHYNKKTTLIITINSTLYLELSKYLETSIKTYEGINPYLEFMTISYNGEPLELKRNITDIAYTFDYKGNIILVGKTDTNYFTINWYGKLIKSPVFHLQNFTLPPSKRNSGCGGITFVVSTGQPLNLVSPTRNTVILNSKWDELIHTIEEELFKAFSEQPTLDLFERLNKFNPERLETYGYAIGEIATPVDQNIACFQDLPVGDNYLVKLDDPNLVLIKNTITLSNRTNILPDWWFHDIAEQISTVTGKPCFLVDAHSPDPNLFNAVWTPGETTYENGDFTICTPGNLTFTNHIRNFTIEPKTILVIESTSGYDATYATWWLGTNEPTKDLDQFDYAVFDNSADYDEDAFAETLDTIKRTLLGNYVSLDTYRELTNALTEQVKNHHHKVLNVSFEFSGDEHYPHSITISSECKGDTHKNTFKLL